jgi:predicted Ser/Thr protein kinase
VETGIPKRIGRYSVERLLGSGAMGFVFLGRDRELDRAVAIKTVRDLGLDEERLQTFLERFRNEARAAARLHHPSIVQVYDVGEDPQAGPFLVFEYVAGATLKQLLRSRGPLSPSAAIQVAEQVADALDTAHAHGIIHRDLKPDNILVTPDGQSKLADFGVARVPNAALTREGQFLGTPCYSAPETLREGRYGEASDLFSFAALLYEAITGTRAFPGDDAVAVAHKVLHDEPAPPRTVARGEPIPEPVETLLLRGLSKDPDQRFKSGTELALALRGAYQQAGVPIEEASLRPGTGRFTTSARGAGAPAPDRARRPTGALAFVGVMVGGLALGVGLIFALGNGREGSEADAAPPPIVVGPDSPDTDTPPPTDTVEVLDARPVQDASTVVLSTEAGPDANREPQAPSRGMTAHEREEAAKDALGRARRLLAAGDRDGARQALEQARHFDPGVADISQLEAQLR